MNDTANDTPARSRRWLVAPLLIGLAFGTFSIGACAFDGTKKAKQTLSQYGTIEAEWQIRDEEEKKTYTYVMLHTKSDRYETYEIVATDGRRATEREHAGGIDADGCYLTPYGMNTRWIAALPTGALEEATKSGDETRTPCLEYEEKEAWQFVPAEDRKAAQPPPPPPPSPSAGPDAGTPDGGTGGADAGSEDPDASNVESALPL